MVVLVLICLALGLADTVMSMWMMREVNERLPEDRDYLGGDATIIGEKSTGRTGNAFRIAFSPISRATLHLP